MTLLLLCLASPTLVAATNTVINALTWTRGRVTGDLSDVSVCIPARDEEDTLEAVVRAALDSDPMEVVVCDDNSTDATPKILRTLQTRDPRLRILNAPPLPAGWVGKVRACHLLSQAARGSTLVFVDADTQVRPGGLQRMVHLLTSHSASVVTAVPRQVVGSWMERLVVPLLHVTYVSWLPLALVWASNNSWFVAANGQIVAVHRDALADIGGFEAIKDQLVDDMALCKRAKDHGHRVVFADGHHMADCRMYSSASEVWQGFSKNIFEGIGESVLALVAISSLYILAFVAPYGVAIASVWVPELRVFAATILGVTLACRIALAIRHRHPVSSVVTHPIGALVLIAIAFNSMRWSRNGTIQWAGRTYPRLSSRDTS